MKGCAPGLALKQRQKATGKWPISRYFKYQVSMMSWDIKSRDIVRNYPVDGGSSLSTAMSKN